MKRYAEGDKTMDVSVKTVTTDSFSMDYCRFGRGKGTLAVLPGISVQSVMPLAEALADAFKAMTDDYTVYVFDRRKDPLPAKYTVQDMADDTAEAMKALGLENVDIFGASQGGMMALIIAADHPELVRKIALGSACAAVSDENYRIFDDLIALAKAGKREELYLAFGKMIYPEDVFEASKDALISAAATVTDEELARFITMTEGMRGFDCTDDLGRISCPVLVTGSWTDAVFGGEAAEKIAEGLKNSVDCRLHIYEAYGHAVYDLAPDYRERMLEFLK